MRLREQDNPSVGPFTTARTRPFGTRDVWVVIAFVLALAQASCGEYQNQGIDTLITQNGPDSEVQRERAAIDAVKRLTPRMEPKDTIARRVEALITRSQVADIDEQDGRWSAVPLSRRLYLVRFRFWRERAAVDVDWRVDLLTGNIETDNDLAFWLTYGRNYR